MSLIKEMKSAPIHLSSTTYGNPTFPKKCKFFIWSLFHECITIADNFRRRLPHWNLNPNWCVLYKNHYEDRNHIFITCLVAKNIWEKVEHLINCRNSNINTTSLFKDICCIKQKNRKDIIIFNTIDVDLWTIWIERNNILFKSKERSEIELWEDVQALTKF